MKKEKNILFFILIKKSDVICIIYIYIMNTYENEITVHIFFPFPQFLNFLPFYLFLFQILPFPPCISTDWKFWCVWTCFLLFSSAGRFPQLWCERAPVGKYQTSRALFLQLLVMAFNIIHTWFWSLSRKTCTCTDTYIK